MLLYNGEIYKIKRDTCLLGDKSPVHFDAYENDTLQLLDILHLHSQRFRAGAGGSVDQAKCGEAYWAGLQQILSNTIGDFALVYYDALNQKLVIAKDVFGKRSLLLGFSECGFAISSRAINEQGEEVGIGPEKDKEEDEENTKNDADQAEYIEKKYFHEFLHSKDKCWLELPSNSCIIIDIHENQQDGTVKLIWNRHTINAQLLLPRNLALDADKSPLKPNMSIPSELVDAVFAQLLKSTKRVVKHIFAFKQHFQAKKKGTTTHQAFEESKQASDGEQQLKQAKIDTSCQRTKANIAILFSGGLDSALLTRLIDILIPPEEEIDLINIRFSDKASDRATAISALQELRQINKARQYNLILIDKNMKDIEAIEKDFLDVIYPKSTHMDFNIAVVLYLATASSGYLFSEKEDATNQDGLRYTTNSKIIISGLGADELFGGYYRYHVAFKRDSYKGLNDEMTFDLNRLWIRNLGRDDRAISQNGKEVRFPFLDQALIEFLYKVNFSYFTNFTLPKGTGDKLLLRAVADRLGMKLTSTFKKKAIQFGTGLAKQNNRSKFGSNSKGKGTLTYQISK